MKIKLLIVFLFSLSSQLYAESLLQVKPWPDTKLKDIEIQLKKNDERFDSANNCEDNEYKNIINNLLFMHF